MILFTLYVLTLSSLLQKQYHSFSDPSPSEIVANGITKSILQMHKLSLGEAQLFVLVHTAGGRQRRLQIWSKGLYCTLHRLRAILHRKGGRRF